jgi:hypothetical protein
MSTFQKYCLAILTVSLFSMVFFAAGANAQGASSAKPDNSDPADEGWHVDVIPYIWFAGVHGTTGVHDHETSMHASFSDVFDYLNLGAMGAVEARYNRFLIPVDFMWIKLSDDKALPFDAGAESAKAEFKQTIFTPGVGYRIVDRRKLKVDGRLGVRYWHINGSLKLQPTSLESNPSATADWVDAVAGGKFTVLLSPKVVLAFGGDGGGGTARSDYQAFGTLGFRVSKKWLLQAGYRYMSVNYRPESTFVYDVRQSGLILGATWNVK